MSEEVMLAKLRAFIANRFPLVAARKIGDDDSLLESGVVDSLGILELVTYLDTEFGIQLADDELSPENFGSVNRISRFLVSKRGP